MIFKPIPTKRSDLAALEFLLGKPIAAISYHYLFPAGGKQYAGGEQGLDSDLAAVVLDLGSHGTVLITWAMIGEWQGLVIIPRASYPELGGTEVLNASSREGWRELVGHEIVGIGASWQISGENCPESMWALRIDTTAGSIVIALGYAAPEVEYMPDELVVIIDPTIAHSYQPEHVDDSAWGSALLHYDC
jgi:hypothetical protein